MVGRTLPARALVVALITGLISGVTFGRAAPIAHAVPAEPELLGDLNSGGGDSNPTMFTEVGSAVYFSAYRPDTGVELWVSESGTTRLVRDIDPGLADSSPRDGVALGGLLYFVANTTVSAAAGEYATELWRSDGTTAGTYPVTQFGSTGALDGIGRGTVAVFDGKVFFGARQTSGGLWSYEPGVGVVLEDGADLVTEVTVAGTTTKRLFFVADGIVAGDVNEWRLVYRFDEAGSAGISPGGNVFSGDIEVNGEPTVDLVASGDELYVRSMSDFGSGEGLHRITNLGVQPFATSLTEAVDEGGYPTALEARPEGGVVYARGGLWWVDPGGAPTMTPDTQVSSSTGPSRRDDELTVLPRGAGNDSLVLYAGAAGGDVVLWLASESATAKVQDALPGSDEPFLWPHAVTSSAFLGGRNVVTYWGGVEGTRSLRRLAVGAGGTPTGVENLSVGLDEDGGVLRLEGTFPTAGPSGHLRRLGDGFWIDGVTNATGSEPMRLADGAASAVVVSDINVDTGDAAPRQFTQFGTRVLFVATDRAHGDSVWSYDPASGALDRLTSTGPWESGSIMGVIGNRAVLGLGDELWVTDGTPGGTVEIGAGSGFQRFTGGSAVAGNRVLFGAAIFGDEELWVTDGTAAGTKPLKDINPGDEPSRPTGLVGIGGRVYFLADNGTSGAEPWVSDGTPAGTVQLVDSIAGSAGSGWFSAVEVGGRVFVSTDRAVWLTDGTPSGTTMVPLNLPADAVIGSALTPVGDRVLVTVFLSVSQTIRSYSTDGTQAGTMLLQLPNGATPIGGRYTAELGGETFIQAYQISFSESTTKLVLAATDGTSAGSRIFDPLNRGLDGGYSPLFSHGDRMYFLATTPATGYEMWRTDGTADGTEQVTDLTTGSGSSFTPTLYPTLDRNDWTVIGDWAYFSGSGAGTGSEPYRLNLLGADVITPVAPARYWDSREGEPTFDGQHSGTGFLGAGQSYRVKIAGRGDVPADAVGVVANLTAILPDGPGFATVYPCSAEVPKASHVNYVPGSIVANNVVVSLLAGDVCVFTKAGADFALDVNGFVGADSPLVGITPTRYLDTRTDGSAQTFDDQSEATGLVGAEQTVTVRLGGRGAVPAGADAVFVNVTAVGPQGPGFVRLYPCGALPATSTLNYTPGQTVPNGALAALSANGDLCVQTKAAAHVIVDVTGYIPSGTRGLSAIAPERMLDTRPGGPPLIDGTPTGTPTRLAAGQRIEVQVAGRGSVPTSASAGLFNLTVVNPDAAGFLTMFPCTPEVPKASNVNHAAAGITRANNAVTQLSATGTVCIYAKAGADVILDVTGWVDEL